MMISKRIMLFVQKIYWKWFTPKANFSQEEHKKIKALKYIFSYNKYGAYCVPQSSSQRPAAKTILSKNIYEPKTIEFMRSNCGNGDIVHAGTYFGDFLPALSTAIASGSKIWAFEPNPENYYCARITLEINNIANVVLTNSGLGAKQEFLSIQTTNKQGCSLGGASRIVAKNSDRSVEERETEKVEIVTIDNMLEPDRNVSIIQLDVEGYEQEALAGALKTIQRCLPIIILEVLPDSSLLGSDWFSENILSLGYRQSNDLHGNSVFFCEVRN